MKTRNLFSKVLAGLLAAVMLLSLLPVFASAAGTEGEPEVTTSGMEVNKTAVLQEDGTYTITLEAFSTGTTTTTTTSQKTGVPLDVVLVIDQSGSMSGDLESLKHAVNGFISSISENAREYNVDHHVAMVGYASASGYANTGVFVNGSLVNYDDASAADYKNALVSVNDAAGNVNSVLTTATSNLQADGSTYINFGVEMANKIFEQNPIASGSDRKRMVVVFTDGEPGYDGYEHYIAGITVNHAYTTKQTHNATIYTVGFYSDASNRVVNFMTHLSSNYPDAKAKTGGIGFDDPDGGVDGYWSGISYSGTETDSKYYMTTADSSELDNIFTNISGDITSTTTSTSVTLTETALLKDIIGSHFDLPDDYDENGITAEAFVGRTEDDKNYTFESTPDPSIQLTTVVDKAANTVEVSGLNYSEEYITTGHEGHKIVVTIPGVVMKDDAPINEVIPTNLSTSGIYADANAETASVLFPQPRTILVGKTYVLDYAKPVNVPTTDWYQQSVKQIGSTGSAYGEYKVAAGDTSVGYTPMTTNWNGYDSVMLFGATTAGFAETYGLEQDYSWTKVSMIPANNVYYEDTFVSDESTGVVGITYTGEWTSVGTGENAEDANGAVQGWVEHLANDAADSDGTIHTAKTGAKATFTFSGTGFDLYSRTNMTTGKVYAKVSWTDAEGKAHNKGMMIDTESTSDEYYGIPTLWYSGTYNTYTVTLTVMANSKEGGEFDFCIDGIRIYNPMKPLDPEVESDDVINDGYKDDKVHAMFASVRDILLDADALTSDDSVPGAVFIDRVADETTGTETNVLGTYVEYGPKNEVYLAPGQAIAFNVGSDDMKLQIGLKAPNGATEANFSGAGNQMTTPIAHSTDLYYWILPDANGNVVIKNTGSNLLSVTKLKYISPDTDAEPTVMAVSADAMLMAVDAFDAMPVMAYSMDIEEPAPEVPVEPETPEEPEVPVEPETPEEPEVPVEPETPEEPTGPNVEIENPTVPEEPAEPDAEDQIAELLKKLFSAFRGWLRP